MRPRMPWNVPSSGRSCRAVRDEMRGNERRAAHATCLRRFARAAAAAAAAPPHQTRPTRPASTHLKDGGVGALQVCNRLLRLLQLVRQGDEALPHAPWSRRLRVAGRTAGGSLGSRVSKWNPSPAPDRACSTLPERPNRARDAFQDATNRPQRLTCPGAMGLMEPTLASR